MSLIDSLQVAELNEKLIIVTQRNMELEEQLKMLSADENAENARLRAENEEYARNALSREPPC